MTIEANFDRIAKPYRYLEYMTLGSALRRCRSYFLHQLLERRSALVLGDGDGRFLAEFLTANPAVRVDAVDTSRAMLDLLEARCATHQARLQTHQLSALSFVPTKRYDLVVTHFFLDCLGQDDLERLICNLTPHLQPGALWIVSDFRIPSTPIRPFAWILVRMLYLAFRILTGLRVTEIPNYGTPLAAARYNRLAQRQSLAGVLMTELWQLQS